MAQAGIAPWPFNWNPQPNEFAALFNSLAISLANGGPALVGTATTSIYIGIPRSKTFYVAGANLTGAIAAVGSSTITAQLIKKTAAGTDKALTAAYDLKTAISTHANVDVPITANDIDRTVNVGDTLRWDVGAAGTISTSPDLVAVVEASLMN